jgi:hypothetical protein
MAIFRQYILPVIIVLVFLVSLVAVSARAFLPGDMAAPAPIEEPVTIAPPAVSMTSLINPALRERG